MIVEITNALLRSFEPISRSATSQTLCARASAALRWRVAVLTG